MLVGIDFGDGDRDYRMQEMSALAASAGALVVGTVTGRRARPDAALFAGKGKVDEVDALRRALLADLVIFDHALSGVQQRNLEQKLECRVVDTRMVPKYGLFVVEVVQAWIDPTVKNPRTIHHIGHGSFRVAGETIKLRSKMK